MLRSKFHSTHDNNLCGIQVYILSLSLSLSLYIYIYSIHGAWHTTIRVLMCVPNPTQVQSHTHTKAETHTSHLAARCPPPPPRGGKETAAAAASARALLRHAKVSKETKYGVKET